MRESVTYQAILEEGMAEGIAKGIAEGVKKGAVAEAKKLILLLGKERLGPPDTQTVATLEETNDLNRLEEMWMRLLRANSWQELLAGPPPRRRSGRRPL